MAGVRLIILPIIGIAVIGLGKPLTYVSADEDVINREFPWHVGIFIKEGDEFQHICSGSIIKKRLILTAAHCFRTSVDPADYKVAAGKYHRSWDVTDKTEQRFDVVSVEIYPTYEGASRNYADDIAVLILKDEVILTVFVQPIGVDLDNQYVNLQLSDAVDGYVAAWRYFQNGTYNNILGKRVFRYQEYRLCYKDSPMSFRPFITSDKLCAKYVSENGVCFRDSGAALAFDQKVSPTKRQWFVQGISSLGMPIREESSCTNQTILFTKVSNYIEWLREYYNKY